MKFLGRWAILSAVSANGNLRAQCNVTNGILKRAVPRRSLRKVGCKGSSNAFKVVCNEGFQVQDGDKVDPRVQHGSVVQGKLVDGDKEWDCSTICVPVCDTTNPSFVLHVDYQSDRHSHHKEYDYDVLESSGEQLALNETKTFACKYPNPLNNRYYAELTCAGKTSDGKDLWESPPLKQNRCQPKQESVEEEGLGRQETCWRNKRNEKACVRFPPQCNPFDIPSPRSSRFASWTTDDSSRADDPSPFQTIEHDAHGLAVRLQMQDGVGIKLNRSYKFMCVDQLVREISGKLTCTNNGWAKYGDRKEDCRWTPF